MTGLQPRNELRHLFSGQHKIGRWLRLPLRWVPNDAVLTVLSGPNRGLRWVKGSYTNGCWLGTYEADKAKAMLAELGPDDVFWDVGANVGYYSLVAARRCRIVHAFEPMPRNLPFLKRHVALNALPVTVHAIAVGSEDGEGLMDSGTSAGSASLMSDSGRELSEGARATKVQVRSFSTLLDEGVEAPTVVKMDIEGAEASVLPAMLEALDSKPLIFLAIHGDAARVACRSALEAAGYRSTPLDGRPLERSDEWVCRP